MRQGSPTIELEPSYFAGTAGRLFVLKLSAADKNAGDRPAVVYFPPFAEEMNKARRQVFLQAGALARLGFTVLLVDPYGTGDSAGDFSQARWGIWRADALACIEMLRGEGSESIVFWGLRIGAVLAVETAIASGVDAAGFLLWQPVTEGRSAISQFLRLRVAAEMADGGQGTSVEALRRQAERDGQIEIAGYTLAHELLRELDALSLEHLAPPCGSPVTWIEISRTAAGAPGAAGRKLIERWISSGVDVRFRAVGGDRFWSTVEVTVIPELIETTVDSFAASGE